MGPTLTAVASIAGIIAVMAALVVFKKWRRCIFILMTAACAGLVFYTSSVNLGIDLAGGAELRYRFDTADAEDNLARLRQLDADLSDPDLQAKKRTRISGSFPLYCTIKMSRFGAVFQRAV